jgi:hypothetical protein
MRGAYALAAVVMAFLLGGCGANGRSGKTDSTATAVRKSVSDTWTHGRSEVQHAVAQCKLGVQASTQIPTSAKPELESTCDAGNRGLEGREARAVTIGVCREVADLASGKGRRAEEQAFTACWAIAGKK